MYSYRLNLGLKGKAIKLYLWYTWQVPDLCLGISETPHSAAWLWKLAEYRILGSGFGIPGLDFRFCFLYSSLVSGFPSCLNFDLTTADYKLTILLLIAALYINHCSSSCDHHLSHSITSIQTQTDTDTDYKYPCYSKPEYQTLLFVMYDIVFLTNFCHIFHSVLEVDGGGGEHWADL